MSMARYKQYVFLVIFFLSTRDTISGINPDFTPKWQVGNSWTIIMRPPAIKPILAAPKEMLGELDIKAGFVEHLLFKVIEIKPDAGEMCYVIEVSIKYPTCEFDRN